MMVGGFLCLSRNGMAMEWNWFGSSTVSAFSLARMLVLSDRVLWFMRGRLRGHLTVRKVVFHDREHVGRFDWASLPSELWNSRELDYLLYTTIEFYQVVCLDWPNNKSFKGKVMRAIMDWWPATRASWDELYRSLCGTVHDQSNMSAK